MTKTNIKYNIIMLTLIALTTALGLYSIGHKEAIFNWSFKILDWELSFKSAFDWFNWLSTVSGIFTVVLVALGKKVNFYYGAVNVASYSIISFEAGYFFDGILFATFMTVVNWISFFSWNKDSEGEKVTHVLKLTLKEKAIWISIYALLTALLAFVLYEPIAVHLMGRDKNYLLSPFLRLADAASTLANIFGILLMFRRAPEQWILWIVVDVLSLVMWINFHNTQMIIMTSIFLINAFFGAYLWYKKQETPEEMKVSHEKRVGSTVEK